MHKNLLDREFQSSSSVDFLTGVITRHDKQRFKRMIFRVSRGNALTIFIEIKKSMEDPFTGSQIYKDVFIIFFQAGEQSNLKRRIERICDSFGARRYTVDREQYHEGLNNLTIELKESQNILKRTYEQIESTLYFFADPRQQNGASILNEYKWFVCKEKCLYHNLNFFQLRTNIFYGDCWLPTKKEESIHDALNKISRKNPQLPAGNLRMIKTFKGKTTGAARPPTHYEVNEFIHPFQELVSTYGIASYGEANPTLFTIITFPFMFGMMFGDIAHGLLLLSFTLYIFLGRNSIEKSKENPLKDWINYRFLLLLMSLFAIFNGFIYNDCMSIPIDIFGSKWPQELNDKMEV